MKRNMMHTIISSIVVVALFSSCAKEQKTVLDTDFPSGNRAEIRIYTGQFDDGSAYSKSTANLSNNEVIDRVDVLVYNDIDGTFFDHVQLTKVGNTYVGTTTKDIVTDTKKDVFVLANYDCSKIKDLKSSEMQILVEKLMQTWNEDKFLGSQILSASVLGHNFSNDRVLEINLARIYSKLTLKCVYNYSDDIAPPEGQQPLKPTRVKVLIDSLVNIPQSASIFPSLHENSISDYEKYIFAHAIPLTIGNDVITEMNQESTDSPRVYDLFANSPNLMLFPHIEAAKYTTIGLKFELYNIGSEVPVKVFSKVIKLPSVKHNKNYEVTVYFNSMDKSKTESFSVRNTSSTDDIVCDYEVIPICII